MADDNIYFSPELSNRERACFETGIKLGALYHIMCGIPITSKEEVVLSIEKGIEASISCQPYVKSIRINLDRNKISGNKSAQFDYDDIKGEIISAELVLEYHSVEILAKIKWIHDMQFPLMYIEKIQ